MNTILRMTFALGATLAAFDAAEAKIWLFDMGTHKSELRPGFTRITAKSAYDKRVGYGWRSADGLREMYQSYQREWKFNESRGRAQPPATYANEVTCDGVRSDKPNAFLIDAPAGQYVVTLLCGRSEGRRDDYTWFEASVGARRTTVKIPGAYIFEKRTLRAEAASGQIAIEFAPRTEWLVAAMAVYSPEEEPAVRRDALEALERDTFFLPPDEAAKWQETKHVDDRPAPAWSAADKRRGYAVFARHYSEVEYPNTMPRAHELNPELKLFAAPGEYEPVALTVHPLADVGPAHVTPDDLRCGDAVIPAARIDVRAVRFMLVRPNYSLFNSYHVAPDVLEHFQTVDVRQGQNARFWITIHTPDDARPGVYSGRLRFQPERGEAASVPLALRVLPIRLRKNPQHIYGTYYHDPLQRLNPAATPEAKAYLERKASLERQDMVEHGMNTHISSVSGVTRDAEGRWSVDGAETERRIALDRKFGLAGKPLVVHFPVESCYAKLVDKRGLGSHMRLVRDDVPQSFFDEVTRMVEAIERERRARGWPELLYYPIDEPSTQPASVQFMVRVMQAIRKVRGVRTYITADPTHDQFEPLWPWIDVWCCQPFVYDFETIRRLSREKKTEFWCYPNHISGENDHTPVRGARMTFGFGLWRSGFQTLIPWIYQAHVGDPWNYLDGSSMDFGVRSTSDGEPIPTTLWEAFREGIDDGRYIYTLEELVREGLARGGRTAEAARKAQRELTRLWEAIVPQAKYKYDGLWQGADFDARRWTIAAQIMGLQSQRSQPPITGAAGACSGSGAAVRPW